MAITCRLCSAIFLPVTVDYQVIASSVAGGTSSCRDYATCTTMTCIKQQRKPPTMLETAPAGLQAAAAVNVANSIGGGSAEASGSSKPSRKGPNRLKPSQPAASAPTALHHSLLKSRTALMQRTAVSAPPAAAPASSAAAAAAANNMKQEHTIVKAEVNPSPAVTPPLSSTHDNMYVHHRQGHQLPTGPASAVPSAASGPFASWTQGMTPIYDFSAYCCQQPLSGGP